MVREPKLTTVAITDLRPKQIMVTSVIEAIVTKKRTPKKRSLRGSVAST
jgi:hypothetical protein